MAGAVTHTVSGDTLHTTYVHIRRLLSFSFNLLSSESDTVLPTLQTPSYPTHTFLPYAHLLTLHTAFSYTDWLFKESVFLGR